MKPLGIITLVLAVVLACLTYPLVAQDATPLPTVIVNGQSPRTPEQVEATALKWITVGSTILTALIGAIAVIWSKLNDLRSRQDRQGDKLAANTAAIVDVAKAVPPPTQSNSGPPLAAVAFCLLLLSGCVSSKELALMSKDERAAVYARREMWSKIGTGAATTLVNVGTGYLYSKTGQLPPTQGLRK